MYTDDEFTPLPPSIPFVDPEDDDVLETKIINRHRRKCGLVIYKTKSTGYNFLALDEYMISMDDESLNRLSTAQLMQRLRAHNLEWKGMKHELIQRWKSFKLSELAIK